MDVPKILQGILGSGTDSFDAKAYALKRVNWFNQSVGTLGGLDCPICKNRGQIAELCEYNGSWIDRVRVCECMEARASIRRIDASGLGETIKDYTFDRFDTSEPWHRAMYEAARRYADVDVYSGKWFFVGGAVGCGKTHICTAICVELLGNNIPVHYMRWVDEATGLKAIVNDEEAYQKAINRIKTVRVLYIDDFMKPTAGGQNATAGDIRLAYEIINHRYAAHLPTIITSERYSTELFDIDNAVGSRIYERTKGGFSINVTREHTKNYRMRD